MCECVCVCCSHSAHVPVRLDPTQLLRLLDAVMAIGSEKTLADALRRITEKDHVRIRVSVADAPHIREMRDDLLTLVDGIKNLEILDDRRVGDGGVVIETGAGTIDAKIETQLAEVERTLNHAIDG